MIEIRGRAGRVAIVEDGSLYIVRPSGYITRRMLLRGLEHTEAFAAARPDGWWHVTDGTHFALPGPSNPFLLRRIRRLPGISGYVLVLPSAFLRFLAKLFWRRVIGADVVVRNMDEARALIDADERA